MVQFQNSTHSTAHRKVVTQAPSQVRSTQMLEARGQSKRKPTNENFDLTQTKRSKQNDLLLNQTASSARLDLPSTSTTFAQGSQITQRNAPEFSTYRARRSRANHDSAPKRKQSQNVRRKQPNKMLPVLDDDDDEEDDLNFDANRYTQDDGDEDDSVEQHVTQNQNPVNSHRNAHQTNVRSYNVVDEEGYSDSNNEGDQVVDTNDVTNLCQTYFNEKFDQLRADLANTTNTLAGDVQSQLTKIDKQIKTLSKTVLDNSITPAISNYQNLSNNYPKVVDYNGINLLTVAKAADYKKYARTILKILFSDDELSNSILFADPLYTRPGLDPTRMAIFTDAVGARFKIDRVRFNDFFRTCLRRTLAQLLCDVRRKQKRLINNAVVQRQLASLSPHDMNSQQQVGNRNSLY